MKIQFTYLVILAAAAGVKAAPSNTDEAGGTGGNPLQTISHTVMTAFNQRALNISPRQYSSQDSEHFDLLDFSQLRGGKPTKEALS
ncbi:uncharacterized protein EDB91DRAFT_1249822 [Suillus paluster]|uniref:uncharacterized protein n=1 Tax=Suillus paluster TaxID=48578 RepID=UPI001B873F1C|nr:uncharacterized protein EDB91DRAFT_1249822 [Suillus paluster]KAG1736852.1 hypothetical protein EDB91DRAFT_1249822 [Suillus paluster]